MSKMKIVQANKFLYAKGGADKYFLTLITEQAKLDLEIVPFGMSSNRNIAFSWSNYFSEHIDYENPGNIFKAATRLIWNREAANKFGQLLDKVKPDLVHAHNIYHQLSPSILVEAKKRKIPVVMTLHDYKLICPNYLLFTHHHHCEKCLGGRYYECIKNNCYYSHPRSALAALESFLHQKVWHVYRDNIDLFISPSNYLKEKMIGAGWDAKKIIVLINPAPAYSPQADGERLLYFGRLTIEKGVDVLLHALVLTDEKLDIAGAGEDEKYLKQLVKELKLEERVTFHGQLGGELLEDFQKKAKAVILPSVWAENMSLVLLESLALGKIVIASSSGGTPELIEEGKTGFLFPSGDYKALAEKIKELNNLSSDKRTEMTRLIKDKISPLELKEHLNKLVSIYKEVKDNYKLS